MTDELLAIRREVYRSASRYHAAASKLFAALSEDVSAGGTTEHRLAMLEAGEVHHSTLIVLLHHLKSRPLDAQARAEAEQVERAIALLSFEIRRI